MNQDFIDSGMEGENFVLKILETSYLKYWLYPNPKDENGDKKEICDALILFFDTAIIISVKNYQCKGNYDRFAKKVIEKSSKQLFGAERKIFSLNELKVIHPTNGETIINPKDYTNIIKITVSVGEDFENYEFIDYDENKGIIAILNKDTFQTLVKELDTVKDLTEYLKSRETLLLKNLNKKCNCKEKDLLAHYLSNARDFKKELYINFEEETSKLKGKWEIYDKDKQVLLKRLEDEKSYFIDELIKNDVLKLTNGELLAKELMTLSRFERRIIAQNLFEIVNKYQNEKDFLARRFTTYNDIGFLFIYYPIERPQNEIDKILELAQQIYAYKYDCKKLVLLAASLGLKQWKFGLFQSTEVTSEAKIYLEKLIKAFGWFTSEMVINRNIKEYPN